MLLAVMALLSVSFMTSCDDADVEDSGSPSLLLSTSQITFDAYGDATDGSNGQVTILSNRDWVIEIPESKDWLSVDLTSGSNNGTIVFSVSETTTARDASVSVKLYNDSGFILEETISVTQYGEGGGSTETGTVIFYEPMGSTAVSATTYVDSFTDWASEGTGASTVTFYGSGTSLRTSGTASTGYYTGASGVNNLFFGTAPAVFEIQNITLSSDQTDLKLTFGGNRYDYDNSDNTFYTENLTIEVSGDGSTWSALTYTFERGDSDIWGLGTADFSLSKSASSLYIRFTALESSMIRVDDVTLQTGIGGTSVDLDNGTTEEPNDAENTIAAASDAANAGSSFDVTGTVWATTMGSFVVGDDTGAVLVYAGYGSVSFEVGDVVNIVGSTSAYGGMGQFTSTATITKTGTADVTYPTATVMSGTDVDSYLSDPSIKYVKYTGTLAESGNYVNITIDGASTAIGSISYPADGLYDSSLVDQKVDIYGYITGVVSSKYVQTVAVCIVAEGDDFVLPEIGGGEEPDEPEDPTDLPTYDYNGIVYASDFTETNAEDMPDAIFGVYQFVWNKETNTLAPKYYTSGTAVRMYVGNTLTLSTTDGSSITSVALDFISGYAYLSADSGSIDLTTGLWSGDATSIVFTSYQDESVSGNEQSRIVSFVINDGDSPEEPDEPSEDTFTYTAGTLTLGADSGFPSSASSTEEVIVTGGASLVVGDIYFNSSYNSFSTSYGAGHIYNLTAFEGLTQVVVTEDYQYFNFTLYAGTEVNPTTEVSYTKSDNYYVYSIPEGSKYISIVNNTSYSASADLIDFYFDSLGDTAQYEEPEVDDPYEYTAGDLTIDGSSNTDFPTAASSEDVVYVTGGASFVLNNTYLSSYGSITSTSGGYLYNLTAFEGLTQVVVTEDYQYYNYTLCAGTEVKPTTEVSYTKDGNYYIYEIPAGSKYITLINNGSYAAYGDVLDFYFDSLGDTAELGGDEPDEPEDTEYNTIAEAASFDNAGNTYKVAGTVVARCYAGFIISDDTAAIYVYGSGSTYNVGDTLTVEGATSTYNGAAQFSASTATITVTGSASVTYPTPTVMSGSDMNDYSSNISVKYVEYAGTLAVSGSYYNVTVEGSDRSMSLNSSADIALADYDGHEVVITGYLVSCSSYYIYTVVTGVESTSAPEGGEDDATGTVIKASDFTTENSTVLSTIETTIGNYKFTWDKGTHTTSQPTYYTSGDAIRVYVGNTFTISTVDGSDISSVDFEYVSSTYGQNITSDLGTISEDFSNWSGSTSSVTFTNSNSGSTQLRIVSFTIE